MSGNVCRFQPHEFKELDNGSDYAAKNFKKMLELSNTFTNPSLLKLLWDSKIPEKDVRWYYFLSLTPSNRDYVMQEIKKYQEFYKDMGDAVCNAKQGDISCVDQHKMIKDLKKKLSKMADAADLGKNATDSSTIYELHKSFIKGHEKLESMIKHVELVVVTDGFQKSTQTIDDLEKNMKKYEKENEDVTKNLCKSEEKLSEKKQQNENLIKNIETMQKNQEELRNLLLKTKEQLSESEKTRQKQEAKLESLKQMELERFAEQNQAYQQETNFFEIIQQLREEQNILRQENASMKIKLEKMSNNLGSSEKR